MVHVPYSTCGNLYAYGGNNPVRYTDPDGRVFNIVTAAAGAVIGGCVGFLTTTIAGGTGKDIVAATIGGAAGGALAGFTCGASFAATAAVGGVAIIGGAGVAAGTDIAINAAQGNDLLDGVDKAALGGGIGGGVGYVAGAAIGKTIAAIKSAKTQVVMPSKPHTNGTNGHWETIIDEVDNMKASGSYNKIYVNKGIRNEIPNAPVNRRPDIMGVRSNGKIDQIEVPSKTDSYRNLLNRMKDNQNMMGNRAGTIKVKPIGD